MDFYPRSPCGERLHFDNYNLHCVEISIHALLAESDNAKDVLTALNNIFLSTLSLRRATHYDNYNLHCVEISIHALLAESDEPESPIVAYDNDFYPRSPCGERHPSLSGTAQHTYFYPRSPCGERLWPGLLARPFFIISIHALLAESDQS